MLDTTRRHLFLAGFMGTGKSAVGREVAACLGQYFIDLDSLIEQMRHRPIAEIFRTEGEEAVRLHESHALRLAIVAPGSVIALGGGTPLRRANADMIRATGYCVLLTADWPTIWERVNSTLPERPLLASAGERPRALPDFTSLAEPILKAREIAYMSVAHITIDTSGRPVTQIAEDVVAWYTQI